MLVGIARPRGAVLGGVGITLLMTAALVTHLRVKNPPFKMLPSAPDLVLSVVIAYLNYQIPYPEG